jgi:hypothetical protein
MQQNMMMLEQLLGLSGSAWLPVTILVGLLLVLIFRPNTIHNLMLFRMACWLLGSSIIAPPVINLLAAMSAASSFGGPSYGLAASASPFLFACASALGTILLGASILCGLFSLLPPAAARRDATGPVKHPLE